MCLFLLLIVIGVKQNAVTLYAGNISRKTHLTTCVCGCLMASPQSVLICCLTTGRINLVVVFLVFAENVKALLTNRPEGAKEIIGSHISTHNGLFDDYQCSVQYTPIEA